MRNRIAAAALAAIIGWATGASASAPPAAARVAVRIYDATATDAGDLAVAQAAAEAVLRTAGLETQWIVCSPSPAGHPDDRCTQALADVELAIRIVKIDVPARYRGTLPMGYALIDVDAHSGSLATMYLDRVQWLAHASGADARVVLGHAMAHEIGHLLLGTNAHARAGLMRAQWTAQELQRQDDEDWKFSRGDAKTMRERVNTGTPKSHMPSPNEMAKAQIPVDGDIPDAQ